MSTIRPERGNRWQESSQLATLNPFLSNQAYNSRNYTWLHPGWNIDRCQQSQYNRVTFRKTLVLYQCVLPTCGAALTWICQFLRMSSLSLHRRWQVCLSTLQAKASRNVKSPCPTRLRDSRVVLVLTHCLSSSRHPRSVHRSPPAETARNGMLSSSLPSRGLQAPRIHHTPPCLACLLRNLY